MSNDFERRVILAAGEVLRGLEEPRYSHTSHLLVRTSSKTLVDEHVSGPDLAETFSVTKSVLALATGAVDEAGLLPPLDDPLVDVLPELSGTPASKHTWRHLLTMTRGAQVDGPFEADVLTALPRGQVARIASAPQLSVPGSRFAYDNGGAHLLAAALTALVGEPISSFTRQRLFDPLGLGPTPWLADPDGVPYGHAHLAMSARDLGALGALMLTDGLHGGRRLISQRFLQDMCRRQSSGGPPEGLPYGFLVWLEPGGVLFGGWAGQHVLVLPTCDAVVVVTGDPRFELGPPATDQLRDDWAPALELVRRHLVPVLQRG